MMLRKNFGRTGILILCVGIALNFMFSFSVFANEFPSKPIQLIIPFSPGGSHDAHARAFSGVAPQYFGVPVLSVIKSGGGTVIAAKYVTERKPDGYTLILGDQKTIITRALLKPDLPYSHDSFVAIGRINYSPMMIVAHADDPRNFNNLKDLIEYARKHPNEIVSPTGVGGAVDQLTIYPVFEKAGVKIKYIPISGGGPQFKAFLSKDVDIGVFFPSTMGDYVKKGKIKVLAVASPERIPQYPDLPTIIEQGYDHQFAMFRAIYGPKGIPAPRLKKLRQYFEQTVKDKSFQSIVKRMGERVIFMSGEDFQNKFMPAEVENMKAAIKIFKK